MPKEKVKKAKVEVWTEDEEVEEVEEVDEVEEEVETVKKKAVKAAIKAGVPRREAVDIVDSTPDPDPDDKESLLAYIKKVEKKIDRLFAKLAPSDPPKKEEKGNGKVDDTQLPPRSEKTFSEWWDTL